MFKELASIVAERSIHILLAPGKDGRMTVYIEPVKKDDKEDDAFVTPLRLQATPEELDAELGRTLNEWVHAREQVNTSLAASLAASKKLMESNAEAAKKEAAEKAANAGKKPGTTGKGSTPLKASAARTALAAPAPNLLDDGEGDASTENAGTAADPVPAQGDATSSTSVLPPVAATAGVPAGDAPESSASAPVAASTSTTAAVSLDSTTPDLF